MVGCLGRWGASRRSGRLPDRRTRQLPGGVAHRPEGGELDEKIRSLNERHGLWTYVIASYKAESLTATREDLVKEKEKPEDEAAQDEQEE